MVMCILSAIFCLSFIVLASGGFSETSGEVTSHICFGMQMIVALVSALSAISASAISCRVVCCGKQRAIPENVIYSPVNQPHQPISMTVPPNQLSNSTQLASTNINPSSITTASTNHAVQSGQYEVPSAPSQVEVEIHNIGKLHFTF